MNDITLTFGMHSGKKLSEINRSYVEWLAKQDIRKQPEAAKAAQEFLKANPVIPTTESAPKTGQAPRTYEEASKLGWMAERGYGNAKATLLAARDKDGFIVVKDEDDEHLEYRLLSVSNNGAVLDASLGFLSMSYAQVEAVLARYPKVEKSQYLVKVAEREASEADEKRRRLVLKSQDGKHKIRLTVWSAESIDVVIDGNDQGSYKLRDLNDQEHNDPKWKAAAAILEADEDDPLSFPGSRNIGLTAERKALIEQKIEEVK